MSQEVEEIKKHRVPQKLNQLLACRVCALVKDRDQFGDYGCDNCGPALVWSTADVVEMTTSSFSGYVKAAYALCDQKNVKLTVENQERSLCSVQASPGSPNGNL